VSTTTSLPSWSVRALGSRNPSDEQGESFKLLPSKPVPQHGLSWGTTLIPGIPIPCHGINVLGSHDLSNHEFTDFRGEPVRGGNLSVQAPSLTKLVPRATLRPTQAPTVPPPPRPLSFYDKNLPWDFFWWW
jgi:hypothetical protein